MLWPALSWTKPLFGDLVAHGRSVERTMDKEQGLCGAEIRPCSATDPSLFKCGCLKAHAWRSCPSLALASKAWRQRMAPTTFGAQAPSAKHWAGISLSQRQQQVQPGRVARMSWHMWAQSVAKRRLEHGRAVWMKPWEEGGPTFRRRSTLSIRGFRAWFLRSIIGRGLQGRLWNIHNEPLRMAASLHPNFDLRGTGEQCLLETKSPSMDPR